MKWLRRRGDLNDGVFGYGVDTFDDPFRSLEEPLYRNRLAQAAPYVFAGFTLIVGLGFVGHYLGQNASARGVAGTEPSGVAFQPTTVVRKSSLLKAPSQTAEAGLPLVGDQASSAALKSDPVFSLASLSAPDDRLEQVETLVFSPAVWKLEDAYARAQAEKERIAAERKRLAVEESCLARAVYFEARSEPELGQKAVAKVIMNRVKDRKFPNTICGVVYQGKGKPGCQFSFACDGRSDQPRSGPAWQQAKKIAHQAIAGKIYVDDLKSATHFHADYVQPKWAGVMKRRVKIGRHIFYDRS